MSNYICYDSSLLNTSLRCYNNIEYNFFLNYCFFQRLNTFNNYGGVIYLLNTPTNLSIIESTFYNCSSLYSGGAIYFHCGIAYARNYLYKICAYQCFTLNYEYQFGLFLMEGNKNNTLEFLSITKCQHEYRCSRSFYVNSRVKLTSINSSYNKGNYESILYFHGNIITSKYCDFFNNSVQIHTCLYLQGSGSELSILHSINFISNFSPQYSLLYVGYQSFTFNNCIFQYNYNNLFRADSAPILIVNSVINHPIDLIGSINSIECISEITETLRLTHLHTFLCHAENPLTPKETLNIPLYPSPINTPYRSFNDLIRTPFRSFDDFIKTPQESFDTLMITPYRSFDNLIKTPERSFNGLIKTPYRSFDDLIITPQRSFDDLIKTPQRLFNELIRTPYRSFDDNISPSAPPTRSYIRTTNAYMYETGFNVETDNTSTYFRIMIIYFFMGFGVSFIIFKCCCKQESNIDKKEEQNIDKKEEQSCSLDTV